MSISEIAKQFTLALPLSEPCVLYLGMRNYNDSEGGDFLWRKDCIAPGQRK